MDSAEKKNILVVDDDREIVRAIALNLESEGYTVFKAYDGMEALDLAMTKDIHLIIIDVMMPRLDGLSAIMKIREKKNLPIIVLSAKSENSDKVIGLSMGADDYITKPFNPMELVARVKSQLRRYTSLGDIHSSGENTIVNGRLTFNLDEHVLYADGEPVKLTATETKIVELLMRNPGRIFPAEEIYSKIWNESAYSTENTVMVHIRRIREKIEINPGEPEYLKVVWGIGYKFEKHWSKGAESRGRDMFKGAVSWLSFMILLCTLTAGLLSLLFVALDPTVAAGLGEAIVNLTYGEYPQWLPVMACSLVLLAASILVLVFAFRRDRRAFEDMLAAWLAKIWVEFKLLFILLVLLFTMTIDMYTNFTYGWFTVIAAVVFLYFLCLDIGKNRRFFRHNIVRSLLRALNDYRDLTSFEQRSIRRLFSTLAVIVGVLGISAVLFIALWRAEMDARAAPIRDLFLLAVVSFALAGVIGSVFWYTLALKRDLRDWNVLMGQIREMYSGNLNAVNHIAPNSNLYDCAMQLNMIRTGIQKAVEEGVKADRTKVELITNVSHDIKTPLTSIISYVELLKKEPDLPPHVVDYINTISRKADRLNHIVQDVFEVSKAATGNISLNLEDLDIGKLLQQTFGEMEETLRHSTLTWRVDIPDAPMLVHADGQRLYRVFQNLIRNCDQYALEGSRAYVSVAAQNGVATVSIRNISRSEITMDAEHLTARFVRGDQNRTTEGSGLGLSIAKSFTEACGGKFHLHTDGDLFIVTVQFPLVRTAPVMPPTPAPAPLAAAEPPREAASAPAAEEAEPPSPKEELAPSQEE